MARQRAKSAELARLFNSIDRPVYVLDEELVIRFLNEPCREWLGEAAESVVGQRCTYRTSPAGDESRSRPLAEALCPPPSVLSGQVATGIVVAPDGHGGWRRRLARFIPIGPCGEAMPAVVTLVEPGDLSPTDEPLAETRPHGLEPAEPTSDELHERIRRFRRQAAGRYRIDRLLGDSPAMRLARARAELAAAGRANVLVVGPVGSGRRHTAHGIHYASDPPREGTLIPVDCAVLGVELIRSTVHALASNPLGTRAARSTLLLTDVDCLPGEVHSDVAAAISAKSFRLRVVATAAEPLIQLAARGGFSRALAALLSPIVIELPPLADRREDIPLLAQLFLEEINAESTKQRGGFSADALDRLDAYHWPGNLDELALVVAQACEKAEGAEVQAADLPSRLRHAAEAAAHPRREEPSIQLDEFLGRIERELIERALAQAKGNKTKAAVLLGLTRPRLYRRLVQLGLDDGEDY
ncbi:MAG: sigma 54-interacting transcriptional regulator [Pirellulaceae bacterium]|nr:sigma 54-interacting transcriptional regulator [Pirellulaceae bacterium]